MDLGERIAAWRAARGMTRRELAETVEVTLPAVYSWETTRDYRRAPSQATLERIVEAFGVSMHRFFGPVPKPKRAAA